MSDVILVDVMDGWIWYRMRLPTLPFEGNVFCPTQDLLYKFNASIVAKSSFVLFSRLQNTKPCKRNKKKVKRTNWTKRSLCENLKLGKIRFIPWIKTIPMIDWQSYSELKNPMAQKPLDCLTIEQYDLTLGTHFIIESINKTRRIIKN